MLTPPAFLKVLQGGSLRTFWPGRTVHDAKVTLTPTGGRITLVSVSKHSDVMIRICLIIAIVAGLAVAVVNFVQVKEVISSTRTSLVTTSNELVTTTGNLRKTTKELDTTKKELATTKDTLKTTEEARDTALADAERQKAAAAKLDEQLKKTTVERDTALADLSAWKASGITVDQLKTLIVDFNEAKKTIDGQKEENKILLTKNRKLQNQIDELIGVTDAVQLPEGLKAKVLVFDPKWEFVVLDVGENQGVLERGELLVNRNSKLVAKVRILRVDKDRSIANVVPGWKLGEIVEGDSAIPAF
jgi:hypothetical protein